MAYKDLLDKYVPDRKGPFSALIYGPPGSGKTTLAMTFPNALVVDADRGLKSIGKPMDRMRLNGCANPYETVLELLRDANNSTGEFAAGGKLATIKTIIFDSGTALVEEHLVPQILKMTVPRKVDNMTQQEYGLLRFRLQQISSLIKDVSMKMNVVMTATSMLEKDEDAGTVAGRPNFMGSFREMVGAIFDEEYFLTRTDTNGIITYGLYARPYRLFEGKTRRLAKTDFESATFEMLQQNLKP